MDTSKKYYEDKIRDFNRYRRGRTLAQFCKDEGIDYEWMQQAKRKYSGRTQPEKTEEITEEENILPFLIELHYEDDSEVKAEATSQKAVGGEWKVGTVILTDPQGNEITINCGSAAALRSPAPRLHRIRAVHKMVRRREVPQAGVQHHKEEAYDVTVQPPNLPNPEP